MNRSPLLSVVLSVLVLPVVTAAADRVVINEIFYQPPSLQPGDEWIELHNPGTTAVNLLGWRFTKGIEYTFSFPLVIPARGYAVVAADPVRFSAKYPEIEDVAGPWIGTLRNSGETLELRDAAGERVNEVTYTDEGDWATRVPGVLSANHRGWDWFAAHSGGGKSLELINPNMPNSSGQNWASSLPNEGTPSARNSVYNTNTPPLILDTVHFPAVPRSTNSVTITSRVLDPLGAGTTVRLFYRADALPPNPFTSVLMADDGLSGDGVAGDRVYGSVLPPMPHGRIIEFYVQAVNAEDRTNTWPAPVNVSGAQAQSANALFQVDDSTYAGDQPIYRLVMTAAEKTELETIISVDRQSDAMMNAAMVTIDGVGTEVRYLLGVRIRGAGSRGRRPSNLRVEIPRDRPWHGVSGVNLNTQYTHSQMAGYALALKSGLHTESARVVQVRINGINEASPNSPQFGSYMELEVPNSEFIEPHFPLDPNGNLYRASSGSHQANLTYRGTNANSYISAGYAKQSNTTENDWTDLVTLTDVLNNTPDATYVERVREVVNVDAWMLFFAVFTMTESEETSLGTGSGDDYALYRGIIDPRFLLISHDWDTILGQGDNAGNVTRNIFRAANLATVSRFLRHPEFVPVYYGTLKRLLDTTFSDGEIARTLDEVLGSWVPAGTINSMKTFATNRNAYVRSQIPLTLTVSTTLPIVGGFPQVNTPVVSLSGFANVIDTRTVLINEAQATWSAWEGRWSGAAQLHPGINRILIRTLGTNDLEVDRTTIDIWYNAAGVNVSGTVSSSTTWNAAGGPYNVTGSLSVPAGVTLTIEPGASVFMSPGASIHIAGKLLAEGTETQHIRFTRVPGGGTWGSLNFLNSTNESRLAYVDIDGGSGAAIGGTTALVHVNNAKVFFDRLVFANSPAVTYLSFDNSSFIVQRSTFPAYPSATSAPKMVHGVNGFPADGYGIFRDNYFGRTWGRNDTIEFTGGNRPGAILQIINNVFDGAGDDQLNLDSTDAWIEGNIFLHVHRDPNRTDDPLDAASAISGGAVVPTQYPEWTIINNLFYDVDHAVLNKGGGRFTFINNTLVHVAKENGSGRTNDIAAFIFSDSNVPLPDASLGAGAYIAGNIIWDAPMLAASYNANNHTVVFENNILPLPWNGPGTNNIVADPRLNLALITNVAAADWKTVKAAFTPRSGSPALGAGIGGFDLGGLNPPGLLVFGEPAGTTSSRSATLTVAPGGVFNWGSAAPPYEWGYTHYRWKLDDGPWSAETSVAASPTITLTDLSGGAHTVYVSGRNDAGFYQDDPLAYPTNSGVAAHVSASRTWVVDLSGTGRVIINEVLARNAHVLDHENTTPDVVELFNAGGATVDLSGKGLTDNPENKYRFSFPPGTTLGPGQYLIVFADDSKTTSGLHLGFALNQTGDALYLYDTSGSGGALLDSVIFGPQLEDLSIGRLPNGDWGLTYPTFGAANVPHPVGDIELIRINEWLADATVGNDFIELYNLDVLPVALGGAYLSDMPISAPTMHQLRPLTFIAASGFLPLIADGDPEDGGDHVAFKLSPHRGTIALFSPALQLIDCILYGPQSTDVSQGRAPNGAATVGRFDLPTPGAPNPGGIGDVIITVTQVPILPLGASWRFDQFSNLTGVNWMATNYNDSFWQSGNALLGFENDPGLPFTITTPVNPGRLTYYFRTQFVLTSNLNDFSLLGSTMLDDGAVIYLNGTELTRIRIPAGTVTYNTLAATVNNATPEDFTAPGTGLRVGTNYLAAEVHQSSSSSGDLVWGLQLDAVRYVTNPIVRSVVINEVMANNRSFTNEDGTITDWMELFNPGGAVADLSDMSLSDNVGAPRRWVFPAGTTIAPGAYRMVKFDPNTPASTSTASLMNAGFGFDAGGDRVLLFDAPARGGALLDSVQFGLQAADYTIGRIPNGSGAWVLTLPTERAPNIAAALGPVSGLRINEWMAAPRSGDDWFELYNLNNQPVDLSGLYLTDDLTDRTQYRIPNLSFIGAGLRGYAEFRADNNPGNGADHTNFRLSASGESIGLFSANALTLIDSVTFGPQLTGVSEGRFPDGSTNIARFPRTATPGQANYQPLTDIWLNEALTHSDFPFEDAIELFNPTASPVHVGGWYLSDAQNDPRRFRIPDGTIIPPGGFAVFYEYQFNPLPDVPPSFSLSSANGDEIYLSVADDLGNLTGFRAVVDFGPQANGVSFGNFETSIGSDFVSMTSRSFGGATVPASLDEFRTGRGATNPYPLVGPVVINEIHYRPRDIGTNDNTADEFIELYNFSPSPVPLYDVAHRANTWRLRDAVDFNFPSNTVLAANGYLLVVGFDPATNAAQLAAFRTKYSVNPAVPVLGPYSGRLANSDDEIELRKPDEPNDNRTPYVLVERVHYRDRAPWPAAADGNTNNGALGVSLQRVFPRNYANDPVNWVAGAPTAGATNGPAFGVRPAFTLQPADRLVARGAPVLLTSAATGAAPLTYQWRYNGIDIPDATNSSFTINNAQFTNSGNYSVRIANPFGAAVSTNALLMLQAAPEIVFEPQGRVAPLGGTVSITVGARGTPPLGFQWRREGVAVSGATSPTLSLTNLQPGQAGNYTVVITNSFGSITSAVALLELSAPPVIAAHPQSATAIIGTDVNLSVTASGSSPLRYQWRLNGLPIPGAIASSLSLNNVQPSQAGTYSVTVSNTVGVAVSSNATLNVIVPPTVTIVATDPTVNEAGPGAARFTITRSASNDVNLAVHLAIGGTAQNGTDFAAISSPVTIPAGTNAVVINITPINDSLRERAESVMLSLISAPAYLIGSPASAIVTIIDDDNQAPSVAVNTPTNSAVFPVSPTNIIVGATASDSDGTVQQVEFFHDGTNSIGAVAAVPFQLVWTNPPAGTNVITAVATDDLGASRTSLPVSIFVNGAPFVAIVSPTNGAAVAAGNVFITADAEDTNGTVTQVNFYLNGSLLNSDTTAPYAATFPNATIGSYQTFAVAFDNFGLSATSSVVNFNVVPANTNFADMFANRGFIFGFTNFVSGNNGGATKEAGEPNHWRFNTGGRSVWISWTAPGAGIVTADLTGSSFDTLLAVYTNAPDVAPSMANLIKVAENDDYFGLQSRVQFTNTVPGTVFHIAVDGYSGASGNIQLRINLPSPFPGIVSQPAGVTTNAGSTVTFTVVATGSGPFQYQWRFNGENLAGQTQTSLVFASAQPSHSGDYDVIVSNESGSVTSLVAVLVVRVPPSILVQPEDQFVAPGQNATFTVVAEGTDLTYQWRFNNVIIPGATSATYVRTNVGPADVGQYFVVVGNQLGFGASRRAQLQLVAGLVLRSPRVSNGVFSAVLMGAAAQESYVIEVSSNLVTWSQLTTVSNATGEMSFTDSNSSARMRAYRARLVP